VAPPTGKAPPATPGALLRTQTRALLEGPFPHGGLTRGVSDGTLLLSEAADVRALAVQRIRATGAAIVRIPVDWRDVAPVDLTAGFQASDAASPGYRWGLIDAAVLSASEAGLSPLLVVSHSPAFAEAPHRWPYAFPGSWAPSPAALGEFAAALAQRYDGSFPDPLAPGGVLPRVRLLQAWNEPNLARYLEPQWVAVEGGWSAFSPLLYRGMLDAFYDGVKAVAPSDQVIAAGVAPNGDPTGVGRMAPITFLRSLLCLQVDRAGRAHRTGCADPPHFDVLDFHPLSFASPDKAAPSSLDVSIADAAKITGLLGQAERLHTALPAGVKPVWVTEINWESAPQSPTGVPAGEQALWISRALHRLWVAGVSLVTWQFLVDPYPELHLDTSTGGTTELSRPAGLYSAGVDGNPQSAKPKPFLRGFTLPFDSLRVDRQHVRVWGLRLGAGQGVVVQRVVRGAWRTIARLRADGRGVLNALVAIRGAVELRLASGALVSGVVGVGRGRGVVRVVNGQVGPRRENGR
jgi:hypothetical protein